MEKVAQKICDLMGDYHSFTGFKFDTEKVLRWAAQFGDDNQSFVLDEFLHILSQNTYMSEARVREILIRKVNRMAEVFGFANPITFLQNASFLRMQGDNNSQTVLLRVLEEEIQRNYGMSLAECGSISAKYVVYLDDILATGGTIYNDCKAWLQLIDDKGRTNFDKVINNEQVLIVSVLCAHTWGIEKFKWRLKYEFNNDSIRQKIRIGQVYAIENHPSTPNQRFNCIYPCKENQSERILNYFDSEHPSDYLRLAKYKGEFAFRAANKPAKETFFSSPENRVRFENILLNKGIELLEQAETLEVNQRPLGMINPSIKTYGTGTLFFTWRNISNTSPIIFWWEAEGWFPLFELTNRGN